MLLNLIEERAYVGQTNNTLAERLRAHWASAREGDSSAVHSAMRKWDSDELWTSVVLQNCYSQPDLDAAESWWMNELSTLEPGVGYNQRRGPTTKRTASPRDPRAPMSEIEREFYRECGKRGGAASKNLGKSRPKSQLSEAEREKYREWGRRGAAKSKELAARRP